MAGQLFLAQLIKVRIFAPKSYTLIMISTKKEMILSLLQQGVSYNAIVSAVGCSKATISYHAGKIGLRKPGLRFDWEAIRLFYEADNTMQSCRERFGFSLGAWNDAVRRSDVILRDSRIPVESLFIAGPKRHRKHLKSRLVHGGLLVRKCYECGITEWRGQPVSFDLHHVNGDGNDNRLENLTLLCPNCHSQTPNYCGRNVKRRAN